MKKLLLIFFMFFFCSCILYGQVSNSGVGTWRYHLPSGSVTTLAAVGDFIYAASPFSSGYIDTDDYSYQSFNKIDGLSDIGISKFKFSPQTGYLIIVYENGNIDLLKDGEIGNVTDILRSSAISGLKKINHITIDGNNAILSADFGVAFVDLVRQEVRETALNLSVDGSLNNVYASAISKNRDSIYIATRSGLFSAPYGSSMNLLDFGNWRLQDFGEALGIDSARSVASFNGNIYAAVSVNSRNRIYKSGSSGWVLTGLVEENESIHSLSVSENKLLICAGNYILQVDEEGNQLKVQDEYIQKPREALFDNNGLLWVGDERSGLLRVAEGKVMPYNPNAPVTHENFKLYSYNDIVVNLTGGYSRSYLPFYRTTGLLKFENENWQTINSGWINGFPHAVDFVDAVYNQSDKNLYIGTYISGLITVKNDGTFSLTGDEVFEKVQSGDQIRVSCVATDSEGKLWVGNHSVPGGKPSLFSKDRKGEWKKYTFPERDARFPVQIVVDDMDNKWVRLGNAGGIRGLMVYNESGQKRFFTTAQGLPNASINCIAKSKNGEIWVGTNEGISVFQNPVRAFDANQDMFLPIFEGYPLLHSQVINDIVVDGGNRKWIATNNGVWLLNPSGTEMVYHFNSSNSPLLSDLVSTIAINGETGEVFFGTDRGVCSYRGSATDAGRQHSEVIVYPNPVQPGYSGQVGIRGLVRDAYVKITDIYGQLIYETRANGGMAVWNVKNYNGQRAKPGVYLIFSSDAQGEERLVSKMAVLD